jgi:Transposase DDE domain group 1
VQTTARPKLLVTADGRGVVSHASSRLLADLADRTSLTRWLGEALAGLARPRATTTLGAGRPGRRGRRGGGVHLRHRRAGRPARPVRAGGLGFTVWRLLDQLGAAELALVGSARAAARELVWAQRAEITGAAVPPASAGGRELGGLVIDIDASIVVTHSEKEQAAPTFKGTFGYHPILAFCDNSGELLAGLLRLGNAGANTAVDHITVLDAALAQVPDPILCDGPLLVRADGAGCTKAFLTHIRDLRARHVTAEFSVGWPVGQRQRLAIDALPAIAWTPAVDSAGEPREGADVAELTTLPPETLADYPTGTRIVVRRERPHPGAQLSLFEERDGWRYQCLPPTPASGNSRSSTPATAPTPESKTVSAAAKTPA